MSVEIIRIDKNTWNCIRVYELFEQIFETNKNTWNCVRVYELCTWNYE